MDTDADAMLLEALEVSDMLSQVSSLLPSSQSSLVASSSCMPGTPAMEGRAANWDPLNQSLLAYTDQSIQTSLETISQLTKILYVCSVDNECLEFMKKHASRRCFQSLVQAKIRPDDESKTKRAASVNFDDFLRHLKSCGMIPRWISTRTARYLWSRKGNQHMRDISEANERIVNFEQFLALLLDVYNEGLSLKNYKRQEETQFTKDLFDTIEENLAELSSLTRFQTDFVEESISSYKTQVQTQEATLLHLQSEIHSVGNSKQSLSNHIAFLQRKCETLINENSQIESTKQEAFDTVDKLRQELKNSQGLCGRLKVDVSSKQAAYEKLLDELKLREETCMVLDNEKAQLLRMLEGCKLSNEIELTHNRELQENLEIKNAELACYQQDSSCSQKQFSDQMNAMKLHITMMSKELQVYRAEEHMLSKTLSEIENQINPLETFYLNLHKKSIAVQVFMFCSLTVKINDSSVDSKVCI